MLEITEHCLFPLSLFETIVRREFYLYYIDNCKQEKERTGKVERKDSLFDLGIAAAKLVFDEAMVAATKNSEEASFSPVRAPGVLAKPVRNV